MIEPVVAVQPGLQAARESYREVELERVQRAARRVGPGHEFHALASEPTTYTGSPIKELGDLLERYRMLVVMPTDRPPLLQNLRQRRIGATKGFEVRSDEIDNVRGRRRTAGRKRLELTGRPLRPAEAPIAHTLVSALLVEPQLVRTPLPQIKLRFFVAGSLDKHRCPGQIRPDPAGQGRWQRCARRIALWRHE